VDYGLVRDFCEDPRVRLEPPPVSGFNSRELEHDREEETCDDENYDSCCTPRLSPLSRGAKGTNWSASVANSSSSILSVSPSDDRHVQVLQYFSTTNVRGCSSLVPLMGGLVVL